MKKILFLFLWLVCAKSGHAQNQTASLVIPVGHTDGITAVDISPNGRYFLTGSKDQTVKIWDENGLELRTLPGHTNEVLTVAFSPKTVGDPEGGQFILSGGSDRKAMLWDKFGKKIAEFSDPDPIKRSDIKSVAFSPKSKEMLAGCRNGNVWLLDESLKETQKFSHNSEINAATFSPKGDLILTACSDKTAKLWKITNANNPLRTFSGHTGAVTCAVFSASGDTILTGSADGTAILWKLNGEKIRSFQHPEIQSVALTYAEGQLKIITGSLNGTMKIWRLTDREAKPNAIFNYGLSTLKCAPDGQKILIGSTTKTLAKIATLDGRVAKKLKGHTSAIISMALSTDGASLLVAHADSSAKLWNLSSQKVRSFDIRTNLVSVALAPFDTLNDQGQRFMLVCGEDRACRLIDLWMKDSLKEKTRLLKPGSRGIFSNTGQSALTSNSDGTLKFWDLHNKQDRLVSGADKQVTALAFSPVFGSQAFVTGNAKGKIMYWDSVGANPINIPLPASSLYSTAVNTLSFSPDGKYILFGNQGGLTEIRGIDGNLFKTYPSGSRRIQNVNALAFSPRYDRPGNGDQYVLRANGKIAELWDTSNDKVTIFSGHTSEVSAVAFAPKGNTFYTASKDGTIKYWDIHSGKEIATLVSIDSTEWAVSTPLGTFDASQEGKKLMHYAVGMEVVSLQQIMERFLDPGLLAKVTGFSTESFRKATNIGALSLYPAVTMKIVGNKLEVALKENDGGIGKLSLYINGKRKVEDLNPPDPNTKKRSTTLPPIDLDQFSNMYRGDTINTIALYSYNRENIVRSEAFQLPYQPGVRSRGGEDSGGQQVNVCISTDPNIYVIVVGTSVYKDTSLYLPYPEQDALAMVNALGGVGKAMRGENKVFIKHLSTSKAEGVQPASKQNIKAAFEEFAKKATPCDVLIVYFSGHGKNWAPPGQQDANFYYLTSEVSMETIKLEKERTEHAISDIELEAWLNESPTLKQVVFLDACNAGTAAENIKIKGVRSRGGPNSSQLIALTLLNDRTGSWILSGSKGDMKSWEAEKYGHGLLTYSLLKGMNGSALLDGRQVDVSKLFDYAIRAVPQFAASMGKEQDPVPLRGQGTFPIGLKTPDTKIPLPNVMTVYTPSMFQVIPGFNDPLKLRDALNEYFYAEGRKGSKAEFVFYDTSHPLEDAYNIRGIYTIDGEKVLVKAQLYRGEETIGEQFEINGNKDPNDLKNKILGKVVPMVKVEEKRRESLN
ncbi:MAG: caspase family protein [Saprospiraceae bacterium]|nr:caspase family protein [Saprospiraceae bacterium]